MNFLPNVLPHASSKTCEVSQLHFFFFFFLSNFCSIPGRRNALWGKLYPPYTCMNSHMSMIGYCRCDWQGRERITSLTPREHGVFLFGLPVMDGRGIVGFDSWFLGNSPDLFFVFITFMFSYVHIQNSHEKKKPDRIKAWLQSFHFLCLCVMFAPVSSASFELMPSSRTPRSGPESSGIRVLGNAHWRI